MNKYIIKLTTSVGVTPTWVKGIHSIPDDINSATFTIDYTVSQKNAMIFNSLDDLNIVYNFIQSYIRKFHKAYKLEIIEI